MLYFTIKKLPNIIIFKLALYQITTNNQSGWIALCLKDGQHCPDQSRLENVTVEGSRNAGLSDI